MSTAPKIFTISAGENFARVLAEGIVDRVGNDPLTLADVLIFVPTRRAARTLRDTFASVLGGAALGPSIRALGDIDEDQDALEEAADDIDGVPAMPPLRRRLLLATLVQRWADAENRSMPFAQAVVHAGELARLVDETVSEGADLAKLNGVIPDNLAAHWQKIATFLAIVGEQWPNLLKSQGFQEPASRRDASLRDIARRLKDTPPKFTVAAGSTGSIPATAELLKTIAHLENGAVVLPALDRHADDEMWSHLDEAHGQFGLHRLLDFIGADRKDVRDWSASLSPPTPRARFLSEALRPPPTTDAWRDVILREKEVLASALQDFALVEAANPREEALSIAIALREALEIENRTAALVTPDRGLARRVASELRRWSIDIDDSGGKKLSRTPPGTLLALLARAAAERFAPIALLALLKHPLVADGEERIAFLQHTRAFERACLRGLRPEPGLDGISKTLTRKDAPKALQDWWGEVARLLEPLAESISQTIALSDLANALGVCAEGLAPTLWRGDAGESCALLIKELQEQPDIDVRDARDFAELTRDLLEARVIRPPFGRHPRLAVLGPLEARLQSFDLVILGGLNEGTWPSEAATDPWLSRPMRQEIGLPSPERRIGLAAHDFYTLGCAPSVLLTRAVKQDGAPTVPSRWILRVRQLATGLGIPDALKARNDLLLHARALDDAPVKPRFKRPNPAPPLSARPRTLRVTEIETLVRDPYAIYARHVLHLKPLDEINLEPGPAERGTAIHRVLEKFLVQFPHALPDDSDARLQAMGEEAFVKAGATQAHLALWRPRFARAMRWFVDWERGRRPSVARIIAEQDGTLTVKGPAGDFTLRGRADRIDLFSDGSGAILDYKTGRVPTDAQMATMIVPQLPLEGAMLKHGAFGDVRAASIREMIHVRLTGGDPAGDEDIANLDADALADEALAFLNEMVARYDNPAQTYLSLEMMMLARDFGDYDHLARVAEWRIGDAS